MNIVHPENINTLILKKDCNGVAGKMAPGLKCLSHKHREQSSNLHHALKMLARCNSLPVISAHRKMWWDLQSKPAGRTSWISKLWVQPAILLQYRRRRATEEDTKVSVISAHMWTQLRSNHDVWTYTRSQSFFVSVFSFLLSQIERCNWSFSLHLAEQFLSPRIVTFVTLWPKSLTETVYKRTVLFWFSGSGDFSPCWQGRHSRAVSVAACVWGRACSHQKTVGVRNRKCTWPSKTCLYWPVPKEGSIS